MPNTEPKKGILFGIASGFVGITCCVSPVVLVLLGIATAAEAVTLGDTLYYEYGWFFRTAGLIVAAIAVVLFLRGRNQCSISAARTRTAGCSPSSWHRERPPTPGCSGSPSTSASGSADTAKTTPRLSRTISGDA